MPNTTPRLVLVRHGDTEWTDLGRHTGKTDLPLSSGGETRAAALGERLREWTFARVFTSPLQRARRTAELAGFGDARVNVDLTEWHYGDYEGLTSAQIHEVAPDWSLFHDGVPNGEIPADVAVRADRFLAGFPAATGDVLAFSSGHLIRMLAARWLGLAPAEGRHFYVGTASINVLGYEHGQQDRVVLRWNDVRD